MSFGRHVSCAGLLIFFVRVPACFPLSLRCFLDLTDTRANVGTMLNVVFTLPEPIAAPSWESMYGQCEIYFSPFRSPARLHLGTSRALFRELLVQPCFPIVARLGSDNVGTSSALNKTGIGGRGAACRIYSVLEDVSRALDCFSLSYVSSDAPSRLPPHKWHFPREGFRSPWRSQGGLPAPFWVASSCRPSGPAAPRHFRGRLGSPGVDFGELQAPK